MPDRDQETAPLSAPVDASSDVGEAITSRRCPSPIRKVRGLLLLLSFVLSTMATSVFVFLPALAVHLLSPRLALWLFQTCASAWYSLGALLLEGLGIDATVLFREYLLSFLSKIWIKSEFIPPPAAT